MAELKVLQEEIVSITTTLAAGIVDLNWIANEFVSSDLLDYAKGVEITQTLGLTAGDKVNRLMAVVQAQVALDPSAFHTFVTILNKTPALSKLVTKLRLKYDESKKTKGTLDVYFICSQYYPTWYTGTIHQDQSGGY